jgi:hypothetical protein
MLNQHNFSDVSLNKLICRTNNYFDSYIIKDFEDMIKYNKEYDSIFFRLISLYYFLEAHELGIEL